MDPFSITAGALQVAVCCTQCTVNIIKWVGDVRTADQRIRGFYDEVIALQSTYEGLEKSLSSPLMAEAARVANKTNDGAHLWSQIRVALDDSVQTMNRVNEILDQINAKQGFARKIKMQLHESLTNGELARLRQRIQFFNATISLPIQMVCVMLQLEQRGMSTEHQKQLDTKLAAMEVSMRTLILRLNNPSRTTSISGSTLIVGSINDGADVRGRENYLSFARKILSTASAAASTRSTLSTVSPVVEPTPLIDLGVGMQNVELQPVNPRHTIPGWIPDPPSRNSPTDVHDAPDFPSGIRPESPQARGNTYEINYTLAERHLKLAQEKTKDNDNERSNQESAEISFRKALKLFQRYDFSGRIAFQPADIVLMLAKTCVKQEKYDEAIGLLEPVAQRNPDVFPKDSTSTTITNTTTATTTTMSHLPDKLQALAASHMLGEVYLLKGDYDEAETQTQTAFVERNVDLGEHDEKTLESVRQLIRIYRAKGDEEEAQAYEVFLVPPQVSLQKDAPMFRTTTRSSGDQEVEPLTPPATSDSTTATPVSSIQKHPRPSFTKRIRDKVTGTSHSNLNKTLSNSSAEPKTLPVSRRSTVHTESVENAFISTDSDLDLQRTISFRSDISAPDQTVLYRGVDTVTESSAAASLERSTSIRTLDPYFRAIEEHCAKKNYDKAVKVAMSFLRGYPSNVFIIRENEMEKNMRKGTNGRGLAATGKGYAPVHYFAQLRREHAEEMSLLKTYGADMNAVAYKAGYTSSSAKEVLTPLGLAIENGHSNITALILSTKGIRMDFKDSDGLVPLLAAMRRKQYTIVRQILDQIGPRSFPKDYPPTWYGNSPLHDAARHCDAKMVEMLLETKKSNRLFHDAINVNAQDTFGKTPLMRAVIKADINDPIEKKALSEDRIKVVNALLIAGADVNLKDKLGMTAKLYAEEERDKELTRVLNEGGRFEMA